MLPSTLLTTSRQRRDQHGARSELAYQDLKRKTVTLELPPATVLTETVLMEDLNIGRRRSVRHRSDYPTKTWWSLKISVAQRRERFFLVTDGR